MASRIIKINNIRDAVPIYNTWYEYYGDIIISVICTQQRSYVRRKSKSKLFKDDIEMCFWHWDWQYSKIEATYGINISGTKTYEIVIEHENEKHRIDSLVNNVAIEFQHSLGVSIEEMNLRFKAHSTKGYTAYLVLDFTDFEYEALKKEHFSFIGLEFYGDYGSRQFQNKAKKWKHSKYYKHQNLFLDFKDVLVRPAPENKELHGL